MESSLPTAEPRPSYLPAVLYFFSRIVLFLALIPNNYTGVGDLQEYFSWAQLPGWLYFQSWVEFPPIFPWINTAAAKLSGNAFYPYLLLMALVLALAGMACLAAFEQIASRLWNQSLARERTWVFAALLIPLPYTWWYFDLLPLAAMLVGILWLLRDRPWSSGFALGAGILLKWFPGLLLASVWRFARPRTAAKVTAAALGCLILVYAALAAASPTFTLASIRAQTSRTSWETAWALVDGNLTTGAFLLTEERLDPGIAGIPRGNPARIPGYLTLFGFGGLGLWLLLKAKAHTPQAFIAAVGLTWVIFLAWSPGWSPQWILYLLPLILLTFSFRSGLYISAALILLTLLEWPTLLAHAIFSGLWFIVPARLAIFLWLGIQWARILHQPEDQENSARQTITTPSSTRMA